MEHYHSMDIFAYYLSEYDMRAFQTLGFENRASGLSALAAQYGRKANYLKRLRDEYDVVTSSTRKGQRNRPPRKRIVEIADYLASFSFDDLTEIVQAFIENSDDDTCDCDSLIPDNHVVVPENEEELEHILNAKDPTAKIYIRNPGGSVRVYRTSIITQLKKLYAGKCQLCGKVPFPEYGIDICEAHHIDYFSVSQNNDASNILILCPNHHRIIHKLNPTFDKQERCFRYPNGLVEKIKIEF